MIKKLYRKYNAWMDYNPPGALSAKGWRLFNKEFKEQAPIRYWMRNTFRQIVIYPVSRTNSKIYDWIYNNLFDKNSKIATGLKPGYYDIDTRMLHVNFNMLKDFVECELGWVKGDHYVSTPWYKDFRFVSMYRRYRFRNPKPGLDYLEWASKLDDPSLPPHERSEGQAIAARETIELYDWWVNKRPARKPIKIPRYDNQGLDLFSCIDEDFDKEAEDYKKSKEARDKQSAQYIEWNEEDDQMLIRLIKVRHDLWT